MMAWHEATDVRICPICEVESFCLRPEEQRTCSPEGVSLDRQPLCRYM
jgi:hypothetical protein